MKSSRLATSIPNNPTVTAATTSQDSNRSGFTKTSSRKQITNTLDRSSRSMRGNCPEQTLRNMRKNIPNRSTVDEILNHDTPPKIADLDGKKFESTREVCGDQTNNEIRCY